MKILFITNKLPFPKNDGRKNILMQYIETIKNIDNGIEIMNASFIDDEAFIKQKPNEISEIIRLDQPKLICSYGYQLRSPQRFSPKLMKRPSMFKSV